MPSKSKKQQKFFGMVHKCKKTGECASEKVKEVASKIKSKDAKDFASTKRKGLPEKVKKERLKSYKEYLENEKIEETISLQQAKQGLYNSRKELGGFDFSAVEQIKNALVELGRKDKQKFKNIVGMIVNKLYSLDPESEIIKNLRSKASRVASKLSKSEIE